MFKLRVSNRAMISAREALFRLRDGNGRFATTLTSPDTHLTSPGRVELVQSQEPFAIILGCSDSRVPVELIFDQAIGDLFVVRVAGNVATPTQIGSIEFAVEQMGSRLIVVLGHSRCSAVQTAVEYLLRPNEDISPGLGAILDFICPSITNIVDTTGEPRVLAKAVRANVMASVKSLQRESELIEHLIRKDSLRVVGAEYSVETGRVEFLSRP